MFDRVVLFNIAGKTIGMVCHPLQAEFTQLEFAYKWWMTGEGITYQEKQIVRVKCSECGKEMVVGLLTLHQQIQNGKEAGGRQKWDIPDPGRYP